MQGKTINGYTLQRPLGTGGMAEVWYAENKIRKKAAVKLLLPKLCQDESVVSRFLTEAKVMVELNHPNIRQVYDYGDIDGTPAIVMEYLEGDDLKARMKRGQRFTDEELKKWWNQLVSALNYTHAKGIVHRDIKPSNIFIDKQGNVKLLDFGIAKNNDGGSGTMTGSTLGTRIYMSPEQVKDPKRVGPATDAYSLAVSFFHLLSGKAPYDSTTSSDFDIQVSIVNQPLDLSGLSPFWYATLAPYLEKDASKRPVLKPVEDANTVTAASVPDDDCTYVENTKPTPIQAAPRSMPKSEGEPPKRKSNLLPWIIAGAACVAAVVMVLLKGGGSGSGNDVFLANVNEGIESANASLSDHINQKYATFEEQFAMDEEKVGPYWEQAQTLRDYATDLINSAELLKWKMLRKAENKTPVEVLESGLLKSADTVQLGLGRKNYAINLNNVKLGEKAPALGQGEISDLTSKMQRFCEEVKKAIGPENAKKIALNDGRCNDVINRQTLSESITALNQMVSEVQNAEYAAVTELMSNIHAADFTYDEISAKVFAESGYLLSGQTYRAQAMVTAWKNSQLKARVKFDGGAEKEYVSNAQGVIPLEWNCGVGSHSYTGIIDMLDPSTNQMEEYPFQGSFVVAPPAVSVSATKMNVVYRGIDNPIAVGGGVGGELNATASSGTLTRTGNGIYNLRPGDANEVTISISSSGSNLGSMKFRVKDLPKPIALIRNVVSSQTTKSALLAASRVEAQVKDFDFDGAHYDVVGYTFRYKTKSGTTKEVKANSGSFTEEVKNAISQSNVGDMFIYTDIKVRGNDGKTKVLEQGIGVEIK